MKTTILSIFLVLVILISSVNIYALGEISPKVAPQYPLLDFELSTTSFPVNSAFQLTIRSIPTNAYDDGYDDFRWTVSGDDFSISSTGVLTTPNYSASTTLTIQHIPSYISKSYVINVDTIDSGYYRIKNAETGYYLVLAHDEHGDENWNVKAYCDPSYDNSNAIWYISGNSDGSSYSIRHMAEISYSSIYLSVNNSSSDQYLSISTNSQLTESKWRFRERNGSYNIFIGRSPTYSFVQSLSNESDYIRYASYTNNQLFNDEWILEEIDMSAYMIAIEDPEHDDLHYSYITNSRPYLEDLGYSVADPGQRTSFPKDTFLDKLEQYSIFVSDSHGNAISSQSCVDLGASTLWSDDICENGVAKVDLSGCMLAIIMGCYTADSSYSIPEAIIDAGADYAVGTHIKINCSVALGWIENFFKKYSLGYTIDDAYRSANILAFGSENTGDIELFY